MNFQEKSNKKMKKKKCKSINPKKKNKMQNQSIFKQIKLPTYILIQILSNLNVNDIYSCTLTCKQLYQIVKADNFWKWKVMNEQGKNFVDNEKNKSFLGKKKKKLKIINLFKKK